MKTNKLTFKEKMTGGLYVAGIVGGCIFAVWLLVKILWIGYYAGFRM